MGCEHYAASVIIGNDAYEVVEGFVGETCPDQQWSAEAEMDPLTYWFLRRGSPK